MWIIKFCFFFVVCVCECARVYVFKQIRCCPCNKQNVHRHRLHDDYGIKRKRIIVFLYLYFLLSWHTHQQSYICVYICKSIIFIRSIKTVAVVILLMFLMLLLQPGLYFFVCCFASWSFFFSSPSLIYELIITNENRACGCFRFFFLKKKTIIAYKNTLTSWRFSISIVEYWLWHFIVVCLFV